MKKWVGHGLFTLLCTIVTLFSVILNSKDVSAKGPLIDEEASINFEFVARKAIKDPTLDKNKRSMLFKSAGLILPKLKNSQEVKKIYYYLSDGGKESRGRVGYRLETKELRKLFANGKFRESDFIINTKEELESNYDIKDEQLKGLSFPLSALTIEAPCKNKYLYARVEYNNGEISYINARKISITEIDIYPDSHKFAVFWLENPNKLNDKDLLILLKKGYDIKEIDKNGENIKNKCKRISAHDVRKYLVYKENKFAADNILNKYDGKYFVYKEVIDEDKLKVDIKPVITPFDINEIIQGDGKVIFDRNKNNDFYQYNYGERAVLTFQAKEGSKLASVKINGIIVDEDIINSGKLVLNNINEDKNIEVKFEERVSDNVENEIVDVMPPEVEIEKISKANVNGFYNGDVIMLVRVKEVANEGLCSGLKAVTYQVFNKNSKNPLRAIQTGVIYKDKTKATAKISPYRECLEYLTINSHNIDSDRIELVVYAIDKNDNQRTKHINLKIDAKSPVIDIRGVSDGVSIRGDENPSISIYDANYDKSSFRINLFRSKQKSVNLASKYNNIANNGKIRLGNIKKILENDDIYTLSVSVNDLAGNKSSKVVRFSINRFGSHYDMDEESRRIDGSYIRNARNIVIVESNVDPLQEITITLLKNNEANMLQKGRDYKIEVEGGNGEWYKYRYTILSHNFTDEGSYKIIIKSRDKAGNVSENVIETEKKNKYISFTVDKTDPTIDIKDLSSDTEYEDEAMIIHFSVKDNIKLKKVLVKLDGEDIASWSTEEIEELLVSGEDFSVKLLADDFPKSHRLEIIAIDMAGNQYNKVVDNFKIINNPGKNQRLIWSIAGLVILIAAMLITLVKFTKLTKNGHNVKVI